MAKTKRRKVWVNLYEDHPNHEWTAHPNKEAAMQERYQDNFGVRYGRTTPFIESRPGDVVLSREDRDRLITLVNETARDEGRDADREALIVSLLRGGR